MDIRWRERIHGRLDRLYGARAGDCLAKIEHVIERYAGKLPPARSPRWDQTDAVLITYGDQVSAPGESPLATLDRFLRELELDSLLGTLHILPFYPYSSDDGFSVEDYVTVDPALGDWDDIDRLGRHWRLMFDLVLNHASRRHAWFRKYLEGVAPFTEYFIEMDPETDLSAVVRPRSLPLLTRVDTSRGERHVWTTFSADQVDLDFSNPDVLVEMIDVFLSYAARGAHIVRLDAIAYLWKAVGTSCIHLPETHQVVKLLRDLTDALELDVLLLTETNLPHEENVSYLGNGDEAHMVYQFSLPPLLVDAYLNRDATPLKTWLAELEPTRSGTTYFNFTASHDGIGVRPLEGLVCGSRLASLVAGIEARGGRVSTRRNADGSESPYELNVTYVDALGEPEGLPADRHARRFLSTQALMLALRGIPGVYFHSLVGTRNDARGVAASGQPRRINRRKFRYDELGEALGHVDGLQRRVLEGYRRLLRVRRSTAAFHPDGAQNAVDCGEASVVAFDRVTVDGSNSVLVIANLSDTPANVRRARLPDGDWSHDLITGHRCEPGSDFVLAPNGVVWLGTGVGPSPGPDGGR